jgi:L-seryl-tRNA(Ser) seleniumtransferase
MLSTEKEELEMRAATIIEQLKGLPLKATIGAGRVQIGGGTLPKSVMPSTTIDLAPERISLEELAQRLRRGQPAVVGYVAAQRYKIDLKTVFSRQDEDVVKAIQAAFH